MYIIYYVINFKIIFDIGKFLFDVFFMLVVLYLFCIQLFYSFWVVCRVFKIILVVLQGLMDIIWVIQWQLENFIRYRMVCNGVSIKQIFRNIVEEENVFLIVMMYLGQLLFIVFYIEIQVKKVCLRVMEFNSDSFYQFCLNFVFMLRQY